MVRLLMEALAQVLPHRILAGDITWPLKVNAVVARSTPLAAVMKFKGVIANPLDDAAPSLIYLRTTDNG